MRLIKKFVRRLPRTLAELTLLALIAALLFSFWAPAYVGTRP